MATTLIASWMKKKGYVKRIQTIEKRISRLEKFLGKVDYRLRLAPDDDGVERDPILRFFEDNRDEYQELSIYTSILSPSEFTATVYEITRFNAPMVNNMWPWYKTASDGTLVVDRDFAHDIVDDIDQFSCRSRCVSCCLCRDHDDDANPLLRGGRQVLAMEKSRTGKISSRGGPLQTIHFTAQLKKQVSGKGIKIQTNQN